MTGQDLLDRMELINAELQLQAGESDVTKGLLALNVAQDHYESLAARRKGIMGGNSQNTTVCVANVENIVIPSGLLRLDRLHRFNTAGTQFEAELKKLHRVGGHLTSISWPPIASTTAPGKPTHYWTDAKYIWFYPTPDAAYTIRYYGFVSTAALTASGTFDYPDIVALPIALFANKLIKMGLEDPTQDLDALAGQVFGPVLDTLEHHNRDGAIGMEYTQIHTE